MFIELIRAFLCNVSRAAGQQHGKTRLSILWDSNKTWKFKWILAQFLFTIQVWQWNSELLVPQPAWSTSNWSQFLFLSCATSFLINVVPPSLVCTMYDKLQHGYMRHCTVSFTARTRTRTRIRFVTSQTGVRTRARRTKKYVRTRVPNWYLFYWSITVTD